MRDTLYSGMAELCHLFYKQYFPHEAIAARLDRLLKKHGSKNIVFIGGLIHVARLLKQKDYTLTFVDYTPAMLRAAKPVLGTTPLILDDMRHLSLNGTFDAVLAIGRSFTYMHSDNDALNALKAFHRHLKPGGVLLVDNYETGKIDRGAYFNGTLRTQQKGTFIRRLSKIQRIKERPALYNWDCVYEKTRDNRMSRFHDDGHILRSFSKSEIEKLVKKAGLSFVAHHPNFERKSFITEATRPFDR